MIKLKTIAKSILCCSVLFLSVPSLAQVAWDGSSKKFDNGDGTEANPYLIECPAHLAYLGEQVRNGETYEGKYIKQTADLDMGGIKVLPIGIFDEYIVINEDNSSNIVDNSTYFLGTFDGSNKTIDNLFVYYISDSEGVHGEANVGGTGLFGCISKDAVVKRVILGKESVIQGGDVVGTVVGVMNNGGLVSDCIFEGSIKAGDPNIGPLGGDPGNFVGGVVAVCNGGTIQRCTNRGVVNGNMSVGGIVDQVDRQAVVTDCLNEGTVNGSYVWNGGIVAETYECSIKNSLNVGVVTGVDNFLSTPQAIVGTDDTKTSIENCYYLMGTDMVEDEHDGVEGVSAEDIKTDAFLELLDQGNGNWIMGETHPVIKVIEDVNTGISSAFDNDTEIDVKVASNNIMVITNKECKVTVTGVDGKVCEDFVVNGFGSVTVANNGMYIVNIKSDNASKTIKVLIR